MVTEQLDKAKRSKGVDPRSLRLRGGHPVLDFLNTVDPRVGDPARDTDYLLGYEGLIDWCVHAGTLDASAADDLRRTARHEIAAGERVLERARELREAIHSILTASIGRSAPAERSLATLNDELARALTHARVEGAKSGPFAWGWDAAAAGLERPLWALVRGAAELLTSDDLKRVRLCAGDDCGWLFLDVSRNRSRRWCSMDSCGNRAKARRHYARTRARRSA